MSDDGANDFKVGDRVGLKLDMDRFERVVIGIREDGNVLVRCTLPGGRTVDTALPPGSLSRVCEPAEAPPCPPPGG